VGCGGAGIWCAAGLTGTRTTLGMISEVIACCTQTTLPTRTAAPCLPRWWPCPPCGWVEGTVTDLQGRPVAGAQVEIWQCDEAGHYHHPRDGGRADKAFQGFGKVVVGADGQYRFRTIRPAAYTGRTPHIHVKVRLGTRQLLTTQLYVQGDPGNARDSLWRNLRDDADRAAVTVPFTPSAEGLRARFPIIVVT
jgi:protocatechuate 3,4-dioxygenase, beta subunit